MAISTERDRAFARQLPDRFQRFPPSMSAVERVNELVYQGWASCPAPQRRQIGQTLVGLLTPLLSGAVPDDVLREECGDVVVRWIARR